MPGHIANTASVSATPPSGPAVGGSDSTDTPIAPAPAVTLDKQVGTPTGNTAGATIPYAFVVTNTGNVTLHGTITDPVVGAITCPVTTLAPGLSTTCTATYTLTQADADNGHVANTAYVEAMSPTGVVAEATDSTDISIDPNASVSLDKQAGTPSGATAGRDDPVQLRRDEHRHRDRHHAGDLRRRRSGRSAARSPPWRRTRTRRARPRTR